MKVDLLESVKDSYPEVTKEIREKMAILAHEGYPVSLMTLQNIIDYGIDTRDWERDRQN